jgi:undecaprenyl-diphosphatase
MQAVAAALALTVLAGGRGPYWATLLLALAALVGWSRLHLQVHFPSDVLAGAIAAVLWVAGLHRLLWWDDPTRKGG